MNASNTPRRMRANPIRNLFAVLLIGSAGVALAQAPGGFGGPGGPGGPGGRGGAAQQATPPGPPAPVPSAVQMARPTDAEVASVRAALEKLDASTRALLKKYPDLVQVRPPAPNTAVMPSLSGQFQQKHQANLEVARAGEANLLFMGDSITDFWRNAEGAYAGKPVLDKYFGQWKVANFGIAGDTTQGVLYRLQNGEGKGFKPKAIMLMIGTNNINRNTNGEIAEGVGAVVLQLQKDFPDARILLLGIFPRSANATDPIRTNVAEINRIISKLDDGKKVFYMDIGKSFLDASGNLPREMMSDALHPSPAGYEAWAKAVIEPITAMMNGRNPPGR